MSKTTARTFIAAACLLVVSLLINTYGERIFEGQPATVEGLPSYSIHDVCPAGVAPWERAAGLIALMAVSISIAGVMFWDREPQPMTEQASVLKLDGGATRRMARIATPLKSATTAPVYVNQSNARLHEDESLTPLERVIRGY